MKTQILHFHTKNSSYSFYIKLAQLTALTIVLLGLLAFNSQKIQAQDADYVFTICPGETVALEGVFTSECDSHDEPDGPAIIIWSSDNSEETLDCYANCSAVVVNPSTTTFYVAYSPGVFCSTYVVYDDEPDGPDDEEEQGEFCGVGEECIIEEYYETPDVTTTFLVVVESCGEEMSALEDLSDLPKQILGATELNLPNNMPHNDDTEEINQETRQVLNQPTFNDGDFDLGDLGTVLTLDNGKAEDGTLEILPNAPKIRIGNLIAYPNPTVDLVHVDFETNEATLGLVQITDAFGQLIQTQEVQTQKGQNHITLDLANLVNGIYSINIQIENTRVTRKVNVLH